MKILRFNESLDIDSENILSEKYNYTNIKYTLYGVYHDDKFCRHQHIVNGTFNECLSAYNKRLYNNSYHNLFIVKKELNSKFITKEELELLINSEKYNL